MNYKIKKNDIFRCLKDFVMHEGETLYYKGVIYKSDLEDCLTDSAYNINHYMDGLDYFFEYFEKIEKT